MPFLGPALREPPRAVIFDIGRVIIRIDFSHAFKTLGRPGDLTHLEILRELEADRRWPDWQEGRMTPHEWHARIMELFKISLTDEEFCKSWNSLLQSDTLLPDSLFERLSSRCVLALLSNTDPIHVAHMEANFPFVRHFPVRVYSCHVGFSKPSPVIFHHALRELGVLPEEAMFVDDIRENVTAAASLGIAGFQFTFLDELLAEFDRLGL